MLMIKITGIDCITRMKRNLSMSHPCCRSAGGGMGLLTWLILGAVVIAGSTGGFALSQLIGGQDPEILTTEEDQAAEEDLGHIFDRFSQADGSTTRRWP